MTTQEWLAASQYARVAWLSTVIDASREDLVQIERFLDSLITGKRTRGPRRSRRDRPRIFQENAP